MLLCCSAGSSVRKVIRNNKHRVIKQKLMAPRRICVKEVREQSDKVEVHSHTARFEDCNDDDDDTRTRSLTIK